MTRIYLVTGILPRGQDRIVPSQGTGFKAMTTTCFVTGILPRGQDPYLAFTSYSWSMTRHENFIQSWLPMFQLRYVYDSTGRYIMRVFLLGKMLITRTTRTSKEQAYQTVNETPNYHNTYPLQHQRAQQSQTKSSVYHNKPRQSSYAQSNMPAPAPIKYPAQCTFFIFYPGMGLNAQPGRKVQCAFMAKSEKEMEEHEAKKNCSE